MAKSTTKTLPRKQGKPAGVAKSRAQQSHAQQSRAQQSRAQQSLKIAHAIAQSGLASRRTAEAWVRAGAVSLKGTVLREPAQRLTPAEIRHLRVRGVLLPQLEPPRLWRYHKPRGVLVERRGAKTGARKIGKDGAAVPYLDEVLPTRLRGLHAVGRLDLDSEGLLLLTNNGALKRALELPRNGVVRRYRLRVFGVISERDLARLARGPKLDGRATQVRSVRLMGAQKAQQKVSGGKNRKQKNPRAKDAGANSIRHAGQHSVRRGTVRRGTVRRGNVWLEVALSEGRGRELRRLAALFGWRVNRLVRLQYGEVRLGSLPQGAVSELSPAVVERFCASLNLSQVHAAPTKQSPTRPSVGTKKSTRRQAKKN